MSVSDTTIAANVAGFYGGGIQNFGNLTLANSAVSGNKAFDGAGIDTSSVLTLINDTISGNDSDGDGGGIHQAPGQSGLYNVTISQNVANADGSGIGVGGGAPMRSALSPFRTASSPGT